jgi:amino acid transporter
VSISLRPKEPTAPVGAEPTLFVRAATGLVRGWGIRDAFIYSAFAINLVTLGWFIFASAPLVPNGGLLWAVVLSGVYLLFQALVYAALIAVMPRAGGDYVWISRVLGGGLGFVLAATGWWFILWHWVPINANVLSVEVLSPLSAIAGFGSLASFWAKPAGIFVSSVILAFLAAGLVALGMRRYARVQKWCFYGGVLTIGIMVVLLLVRSKADFIHAYNRGASQVYGTKGNAYAATLAAGLKGYKPSALTALSLGPTLLLVPMMAFFNLWSNWGATLSGEVRGVSDFRKNATAMAAALITTTAVAVLLFALFAKTFGWDFYNAANNAWLLGTNPTGAWPYPAMLVAFFFSSPVLQFLFILAMSLWFFGWVGSIFLSSTRVIFAAAFDRVLPESVSRVNSAGVPWVALLLMLIPSIPIAALYAFDEGFRSWLLAATLVIAITFLGSTVAAAVLPWRMPDAYAASPIARFRVLGVPLITIAAVGFGAYLVFCLYLWFTKSVYGLNNVTSILYMGGLYVVAAAIYLVARFRRKREGIDLSMIYDEIPSA